MFCSKCGYTAKEGDLFCINCGAPLRKLEFDPESALEREPAYLVDEPVAVDEPSEERIIVDEPAPVEAPAEEPVAFDEPETVEEPEPIEDAYEEPCLEEAPAEVDEPVLVDASEEEPAAFAEPVVIEAPSAVEEPIAVEPPVEQETAAEGEAVKAADENKDQPAKRPRYIPRAERPLSVWGFIWRSVLFSIPVINIIPLFMFAFASGVNKNSKNYAAAVLIMMLVGLLICVAAAILIFIYTDPVVLGDFLYKYFRITLN